MVRAKSKSEELDIKPFSQNSKTQDTKGAGRGEKWSGEDRKALFNYVEKYGAGNWSSAALSVHGKTAKQGSVDEEIIPIPPESMSDCLAQRAQRRINGNLIEERTDGQKCK